MDHKRYHQFLRDYLQEAIANTNRTTPAVMLYLTEIPAPGRFARNRAERVKAIATLREAFDEHRHWPLDIAISHLGFDPKELLP